MSAARPPFTSAEMFARALACFERGENKHGEAFLVIAAAYEQREIDARTEVAE